MELPALTPLDSGSFLGSDFAFVFAMGFEDRALAIPEMQACNSKAKAMVGIRYTRPRGRNREEEAINLFSACSTPSHLLPYSERKAHEFEYKLRGLCKKELRDISDIVLDVSAMSKFLILVSTIVFLSEGKRTHIAFAAAKDYAPTKAEYDCVLSKSGDQLRAFAGQPTVGISEILRSVCLSSTRMQGQPVCAVAFTSFNEELIRHSIGTLNPHRLILINGVPPTQELYWRAAATQTIHQKLINEFSDENPINADTALLERTVSTYDYRESIYQLLNVRRDFGTYERIIYFATGSKMQTLALAIMKAAFDDVHIEYPIPESYFFTNYSVGVGDLSTVTINDELLDAIRASC